MSKKHHDDKGSKGASALAAIDPGAAPDAPVTAAGAGQLSISREDYHAQLTLLQVELVKLQRHFIGCGDKILVVLEGRDAAGKDGSIKRIVEHMSPRETRVVALGKPSDRDRGGWYFQRYVAQLPVAEEFVLFNRSWYNRAGVEHVMGFCTKEEHEEFMWSVPKFEEMLVNWKAYSDARDAMLLRTHTAVAPWHVVRADDKRLARLNLIRDVLSRLHYAGKKSKLVQPDTNIAFEFTPDCIASKRLAR